MFSFLNTYSHQTRALLYALLCIITFLIPISGGYSSIINANTVLKLELFFIGSFFILSGSIGNIIKTPKAYPIITLMILFWVLSVTISFYTSIYNLSSEYIAESRYHQVLVHLLFFIAVYHFLLDNHKNNELLLAALPLSVTILSFILVKNWLNLEVLYEVNWLNKPPLNDHIRHIGYMATAGAGIALTLALHPSFSRLKTASFLLLIIPALTLVLWTGGRAAIFSCLITFICVTTFFLCTGHLKISRLLTICALILFCIFLSEQFKVFEWNGLFAQFDRTMKADDVDSFTTGRTRIWHSAISSLNNNWLWGLGPQGYYLMPNRIYGVQPHSMFIQFLVEWGIIGTILFVGLLFKAATKIIGETFRKRQSITASYLASTSVLVSLTVHGLVDGTYYHGQPSYFIALSLAICLSTITSEKQKKSETSQDNDLS